MMVSPSVKPVGANASLWYCQSLDHAKGVMIKVPVIEKVVLHYVIFLTFGSDMSFLLSAIKVLGGSESLIDIVIARKLELIT